MENIETFTGITLINKIIEFIALTPDEKEWNYHSLNYNKPRLYRLKRISALLKAFGIITDKNVVNKGVDDL